MRRPKRAELHRRSCTRAAAALFFFSLSARCYATLCLLDRLLCAPLCQETMVNVRSRRAVHVHCTLKTDKAPWRQALSISEEASLPSLSPLLGMKVYSRKTQRWLWRFFVNLNSIEVFDLPERPRSFFLSLPRKNCSFSLPLLRVLVCVRCVEAH